MAATASWFAAVAGEGTAGEVNATSATNTANPASSSMELGVGTAAAVVVVVIISVDIEARPAYLKTPGE